MTKQEILDLEQANSDKIHLFKEGSFWIAYEKSAFRFIRTVKSYKVKKKWIKSTGAYITSLGFPSSALDGIVAVAGLEIIEQIENRRIVLRAPNPLTDEDFDLWKAEVEVFVPKSKLQPEKPELNPNENAYELKPLSNAAAPVSGVLAVIVHHISNFSIATSTPMECMLFVAELKRQIREYPNNEALL